MAAVLSPGQVLEPLEPAAPQEWRENLNVTMICPECREDPPNLVENFSAGDTVCGTCGLVLADRWIDERSEWRTFANDETGNDDPSRVGRVADPLLDGSQLETSISYGDGSHRSRELHRTHAKMINDKATKTLKEAYALIAAICSNLHLTEDAVSYAQQLFKSLEDAKAFKGKNQQNTIAGCIFISCRRTKHKRTFKDITDATRVSKKDLGRAFKAIEEFFREQKKRQARNAAAGGGMPLLPFDDNHPEVSSTDPADICERYCQRLLLNRIPTRVSEELAKKLSQGGALAGRSPLSAAAACIYMASHLMGQPKTPKEIAAVAGVSDGTIRTAYKLLYAERESLIDPKWLSEGGDILKLPAA